MFPGIETRVASDFSWRDFLHNTGATPSQILPSPLVGNIIKYDRHTGIRGLDGFSDLVWLITWHMHSSSSRSNTLIILISSRRCPIKYTCGLQHTWSRLRSTQPWLETTWPPSGVKRLCMWVCTCITSIFILRWGNRVQFRKNKNVFELMILWIGDFTFNFFTFHIADRKLCWFRRYVFTVISPFCRLFYHTYTIQNFGLGKMFLMLVKEVSLAHRGCIYMFKNIDKTVILWTILQSKITVFYFNIFENVIYSCVGNAEILGAITPVFSHVIL